VVPSTVEGAKVFPDMVF